MFLTIIIIAPLLIIFVLFLGKWVMRPGNFERKMARSLAYNLILNYILAKRNNPNASENELVMTVIKLRIENTTASRGLTLIEAEEYIDIPPNFVDVVCALCRRDLESMGRHEMIDRTVIETIKYLKERGFGEKVYSSKIYRVYKTLDPDYLRRNKLDNKLI